MRKNLCPNVIPAVPHAIILHVFRITRGVFARRCGDGCGIRIERTFSPERRATLSHDPPTLPKCRHLGQPGLREWTARPGKTSRTRSKILKAGRLDAFILYSEDRGDDAPRSPDLLFDISTSRKTAGWLRRDRLSPLPVLYGERERVRGGNLLKRKTGL